MSLKICSEQNNVRNSERDSNLKQLTSSWIRKGNNWKINIPLKIFLLIISRV